MTRMTGPANFPVRYFTWDEPNRQFVCIHEGVLYIYKVDKPYCAVKMLQKTRYEGPQLLEVMEIYDEMRLLMRNVGDINV